jgi:hypothetical protein
MLATPPRLSWDEIEARADAREAGMHWYTLAIEPQSWRKIGERASGLGYETYCPMGRWPGAQKQDRSRRPPRALPLLGSYMFVDMPGARRFDLFMPSSDAGERPEELPNDLAGYVADPAKPSVEPIRGCRGLVSTANGPTPVHEDVIAKLRRREAAGEFDFTATTIDEDGFAVPKWYRRNLSVEFVSEESPLRGTIGKISAMSGNGVVSIWVPFFKGMTLVHAPIDWVMPATE